MKAYNQWLEDSRQRGLDAWEEQWQGEEIETAENDLDFSRKDFGRLDFESLTF